MLKFYLEVTEIVLKRIVRCKKPETNHQKEVNMPAVSHQSALICVTPGSSAGGPEGPGPNKQHLSRRGISETQRRSAFLSLRSQGGFDLGLVSPTVAAMQTALHLDDRLRSGPWLLHEINKLLIPQNQGVTGERLGDSFTHHFDSTTEKQEDGHCRNTLVARKRQPIVGKEYLMNIGRLAWTEVSTTIRRLVSKKTLVVCDPLVLRLMALAATNCHAETVADIIKMPLGPCDGIEMILLGDMVQDLQRLEPVGHVAIIG